MATFYSLRLLFSPGRRVCSDADCVRTTGRGVRLPAAFAAPTSDPEHEERCEDEATHPVAQGGARFLLFSLEGGPMVKKKKKNT